MGCQPTQGWTTARWGVRPLPRSPRTSPRCRRSSSACSSYARAACCRCSSRVSSSYRCRPTSSRRRPPWWPSCRGRCRGRAPCRPHPRAGPPPSTTSISSTEVRVLVCVSRWYMYYTIVVGGMIQAPPPGRPTPPPSTTSISSTEVRVFVCVCLVGGRMYFMMQVVAWCRPHPRADPPPSTTSISSTEVRGFGLCVTRSWRSWW